MKRWTGLFILVILIALVCGCTTQQARPPAATETATTVPATELPAPVTATPPPAATATSLIPTAAATEPVTTATPPLPTTFSNTNIIHIRNNTFVPGELTVLPGTGIIWINDDNTLHKVKATGDSAGKFTSSDLLKGAEFHYTFGENTGIYTFGDPGYPDMTGRIIVRKGAAIVGGSSIISQSP